MLGIDHNNTKKKRNNVTDRWDIATWRSCSLLETGLVDLLIQKSNAKLFAILCDFWRFAQGGKTTLT